MDKVTLAHGNGGYEGNLIVKDIFYKYFGNDILLQKNDASRLNHIKGDIAVTTDSFVVSPLFFKGGDIGKLSMCGTINDISVSGAVPLYITTAFIIEEGFLADDLEKIVKSMAEVAKATGVKIAAGDTKVVEKGHVDGIYINTTGVGIFKEEYTTLDKSKVKPGDKIIVSGNIGQHGMAVMSEREFIGLQNEIESDCAPLNDVIGELLKNKINIRVMRDPTRGGLASSLNELAEESKNSFLIYEDKVPISSEVRSYCNMLGIEPMYSANEGRFVAVVSKEDAEEALKIIRNHPLGKDAAVIGEVVEKGRDYVYSRNEYGGTRVLRTIQGEMLPRIC